MSSVAFLNDKTESFGNFEEEECEDEAEEDLSFKITPSDISIPKPICTKKEEWLSERIKKCTQVFNFKRDSIEAIEEKTECLEDLSEFFREDPGPISRRIYSELFDMFSINLCRKIPQCTKRNYDPEEDNHCLEEAWPHIKLVYEIFIKFLEMTNLRLDFSKMYMTDRFLHEMMELMDSDDPREKDMSKTVVHRIYARFCTSRAYLRKELTNILLKFIYDTEHFSGISEILQIYSSIINGLSLPLSEEFVVFLSKVLVPLHKVKNLSIFHHHLTICLVNFLHKDTCMLKIIIEGLIKYWPKTNSQKEVQFLSEIEELLEAVDAEGFVEVHLLLFSQVGKCILSPHFQVVERSLSLFNNPYAWQLVEENHVSILPILMPGLLQRRRGHWNQTVAVLVNNVLKKFKAIDSSFFEFAVNEARKPPAEPKRRKDRKEKVLSEDQLFEDEGSFEEEGSLQEKFDDYQVINEKGDRVDT